MQTETGGRSFDAKAKLGSGMTSPRARRRLLGLLQKAGIQHEGVLQAMESVPRHLFVEEALAHRAYDDVSLPIGLGQTISRPYTVARMTEVLLSRCRQPSPRVLEIGTGSGYQTAVLAGFCSRLFSVERIRELHLQAKKVLRGLGLHNVQTRFADGHLGWPGMAPFDAIIVTAAMATSAEELLQQLKPEGILLMPAVAGEGQQELQLLTAGGRSELIEPVRFVPMLPGTSRNRGSRV